MKVTPGTKASVAANQAGQGASILSQLYYLAAGEADEPDQLTDLNACITSLGRWLDKERAEVGSTVDQAETASEYGLPMKATGELKAEPMDTAALDSWLAGKRSRRILAVPFGGPLPGGTKGRDLDGEYFDADVDLFGPYPILRTTRERLVDWHHGDDPTMRMKGAILGRIVMDELPQDDGYWADFWANAGERRRALIGQLEAGGVPLFGSSQAAAGIRKANDGHILVWPLIRHTITTSPQNTWAVVPPLKALLTTAGTFDGVSVGAMKAAALGLLDPSIGGPASDGASSGSARADAVIAEAERFLANRRAPTL